MLISLSISQVPVTSFTFGDLTDAQQAKVADIFKMSYEVATGESFDIRERAYSWTFFGNPDCGFLVVRIQNSGLIKFTGTANDNTTQGRLAVLNGIKLLVTNHKKQPIWGLMPPGLKDQLIRASDGHFVCPVDDLSDAVAAKTGTSGAGVISSLTSALIKILPTSVTGVKAQDIQVQPNGSLTVKHPLLKGTMTKHFICNLPYLVWLRTSPDFSKTVDKAKSYNPDAVSHYSTIKELVGALLSFYRSSPEEFIQHAERNNKDASWLKLMQKRAGN